MQISLSYDANQSKARNKGKSVLNSFDSYCVIDIETTGLDPSWDSIIEIAALKLKGGSRLINTAHSSIRKLKLILLLRS